MPSNTNNLFEEEIAYCTRAEAFETGILVDLYQFPVVRAHFKFRFCCTNIVWSEITEAVERKCGDHAGILHDLCWMAKREIGKWNGEENILFECFVAHANRHYKVVCGPDDDGKPCFTLMKPNEVIKEGCWE